MKYEAHSAFIEPARAQPELWRLLIGLTITFVIYLALSVVIFGVGVLLIAGSDVFAEFAVWQEAGRLGEDPFSRSAAELQAGLSPLSTLVLLASFLGIIGGLAVTLYLLHKRGFSSLFGPCDTLWRHGLLAAGITFGVFLAAGLLPSDLTPEPNLPSSVWLSFLPFTLLFVLIQTGAEELLFRGYIQQQLAARFASPWIWLFLPSALFAAGHYAPAVYGENALLVVVLTGTIGLVFADLTARTGSLGAAWGLHFANNTMGIAMVSSVDQLGGLALYKLPRETLAPDVERLGMLQSLLIVLIIWLLIRIAIRR